VTGGTATIAAFIGVKRQASTNRITDRTIDSKR
jgi:hypothetical protein